MNAEKLLSIIQDIKLEFEDTETLSLLTKMISALENVSNSPTTPEYQTSFLSAKKKLFSNLSTSYSNDETPQWKHHIQNLGLSDFLGINLISKIEPIIAENQLTRLQLPYWA
jgi:hypothetical protein